MCKQSPPWFDVDSYSQVLFVNEIFVRQYSLSHEKYLKIYIVVDSPAVQGVLSIHPHKVRADVSIRPTQIRTRLRHQMTEI